MKVLTITFYEFNTSLLNKSRNFFLTIVHTESNEEAFPHYKRLYFITTHGGHELVYNESLVGLITMHERTKAMSAL